MSQSDPIKTIKDKEANEVEVTPLIKRKGKLPKMMVRKTHEFLSHVATLRFIIICQMLLLMWALSTIQAMPSEIVIKYAPQLRNGATLKAGEYPKAAIITDVEYLWLAINTWETGGEKEVNKILWRYQNFLSPEFKLQLERGYKMLDSQGSLDRRRTAHSVPGQIFDFDDRVVQLTANSWVVYLDVVLEETIEGRIVRKPTYRYELLVERYTVNMEMNPIGLRLTGFQKAPVRIKN